MVLDNLRRPQWFLNRHIPSHIAHSINKRWGIGQSDSGWMRGSTFFEYISNVFVPWLDENKIKKPIIVFIDWIFFKNDMEIIALYPNSTHLIQPLDVAVFKLLKRFWKTNVRSWHIENHSCRLRKEHFGNNLKNF